MLAMRASKLWGRGLYGIREINSSQDGRRDSSSWPRTTSTVSRRIVPSYLRWENFYLRWHELAWNEAINKIKYFSWSWPTLMLWLSWTREVTWPSASLRRRREGCIWGCRRASGTGSTTSRAVCTSAREEGSSGLKVPHWLAKLITDLQDSMVRTFTQHSDSQSYRKIFGNGHWTCISS